MTLYDSIKIVHILSGALVVATLSVCVLNWRSKGYLMARSIAIKTGGLIAPFAVFQLLTGFTLLSIHKEYLTQLWIKASILGFLIAIGSWFFFVYLLFANNKKPFLINVSLWVSVMAILSMLFCMVNKL